MRARLKSQRLVAVVIGFVAGVIVAAGVVTVMARSGASDSPTVLDAAGHGEPLATAGITATPGSVVSSSTDATTQPQAANTEPPALHAQSAATPVSNTPAAVVPGDHPAAGMPSNDVTPPSRNPVSTNAATPASSGGTAFDAQYCATVLDAKGHSQCGNPANFCDSWAGGFCNDYRYTQLPPGSERAFGSDGRDDVSVDCFSITNTAQLTGYPYYLPTNMTEWSIPQAEPIPFPCAFASMEHFMTRIEDGQFGQIIVREQQPFDFAGRTGHIHLDAALNTGARRYFRLVLSPQLTKVTTDDRHQDRPFPQNALELWFSGGALVGKLIKNGTAQGALPFCNGCGPTYPGTMNARDAIDIYLSRTHIRIVVAGKTMYDVDMPDLGFDRAYVYLDHLNYNSCKAFAIEGFAGPDECTLAGNTFHWDNFAFDGPVLPKNGLTPAGSEDVVFNAYGQSACTVKGVAASSVAGDPGSEGWTTWVARLPAHTGVTGGDVQCTGSNAYRGVPQGLEVVQQ